MTDPIRVMIVDDSSFMRRTIERILVAEDIQIVGTARDGLDALEKIPVFKPDIVTLDVEMPRMDGLACLKQIMIDHPLPVLMLSSITHEGAKATLDALALGALDFITKEKNFIKGEGDLSKVQQELQDKIRKLARTPKFKLNRPVQSPAVSSATISRPAVVQNQTLASVPALSKVVSGTIPSHPTAEMIVLGCSTGGPKALQDFLPHVPKNLPVPILIVQHMPASFTKAFAERLNSISQLEIKEASNGDIPEAGHVYIAPGGIHMNLRSRSGRYSIELTPEPASTLHRPSVDVLFQSAYEACGNTQLLAIILTGMGADGAQGMQKLKSKGTTYTIAESESSCVVYGMPKSAVELGCVDVVAPIQEMAGILKRHFQI
ncbi:MAG: chemotaxis response regulator protein-glutamate methylesterase [Holophagales bacterium]|jgi:two-component system chemotaxis response regulator CheB|nr:chemotaxis response regulator protein-glutamate methylesterase [Holophagales bacterium]